MTSQLIILACRENNDLYRVLGENGIEVQRFDTPPEAVNAAAEGDGVMILADGYPETTTPLDAAVFEAAAKKKLRLYVEFPSMLPGMEVGQPLTNKKGQHGSNLDRQVIMSGAFGEALLEMSIIMVQGCRYVPVKADNPHIVVAQVAGYNKAEFGLPEKDVWPILFEHPRGGILVATTKLSHFVTGRYAPADAWPYVWRMVLEWLQPGRKAKTLRWTPLVRPSYGGREKLPADAEIQALRRGVSWYQRSKLFLEPSGKKGFHEGFNSKDFFMDGSHGLSTAIRSDCTGEVAMSLAVAAEVLGGKAEREVARNLNDYLFFESEAARGPRLDPEKSVLRTYRMGQQRTGGLLRRRRGPPPSRRPCGGVCPEERPMGRAGRDGYPGQLPHHGAGRFSQGPDRGTGTAGTRLAAFLGRAGSALGRHAALPPLPGVSLVCFPVDVPQDGLSPPAGAHGGGYQAPDEPLPDHWDHEANRHEPERCRMLLPLAWLIRVDDTPEHRRWLGSSRGTFRESTAVRGDSSACINQTTANDQYGTGECALVQKNGDPCSDLLYSVNFAFIGLHEAVAATGDPDLKKAEDRMADFLVRIQIRSEKRTELDGAWYRGFDYDKWEYWGSDGDIGWGVWSIETGWTQGWITTTLALRLMKTSFWDFTKQGQIAAPFEKHRRQMLPDEAQPGRAQISLSGNWSFQADRKNEGESAGWFSDQQDTKSWQEVNVPIAFDNCESGLERYAGAGWFSKLVYVPESFRGKRVVLSFEGINYNAKVWVNGKPVGENHDAFLPFTLPINDAVKIGAENKITVRVDNLRTRGQFPLFEGWYGQGGFTREACVMATDPLHLQDTFVEAEPAPEGGYFRFHGTVANDTAAARTVNIRIRILDADQKELTVLQSRALAVAQGQTGELTVEGTVSGVKNWSPDEPTLYTAQIVVLSDGKPLDSLTRRIGFRRVEIKDAKMFLNGKPLFLCGFNRHEDSPKTGMAVDLAQAREDFTAMKQTGCNYVRFCHYPHHPGELDLCDELGLLVLAENAMNEWGHVDHPDPNGGFELKPEDAPLILDNARRTLRKMVQRDNHHPSIIFWSISNENAEERSDVAEGNGELLRYGKTLDRSRPWTHVSNCHQKQGWESFYLFDDVIIVNVYPSHQPQVEHTEATLAAGLPEATKYMEDVLAKLHRQFPAKPIVIGEFGYPDGYGGPESARLQTIATEAEFKGLNAAYVAGCALWVYARHPWANQASYAGGKSIISPYGYVSHDRKTRFPALSVVERLYKERDKNWEEDS